MLLHVHEVPLAQGPLIMFTSLLYLLQSHCLITLSRVVGQIHVLVSSRNMWSQGLVIILQRPATAH